MLLDLTGRIDATDIASLYPGAKDITLIHSRHSFLPLYDPLISQSVISTLDDLGVHRVMGERVDMAWLREQVEGWKARKENGAQGGTITVKTLAGREIEADYIVRFPSRSSDERYLDRVRQLLCTGQVPNASLMATFCPLAVPGGSHGGGAIKVLRSMQVAPSRYGPSPVTVSNASAPSSVEIPKARRMARSDTQETAVPIAAKKKREEVEACDCATSPPLGGHKRLWDFEESSDSRLPASDSDVEGEGEEDEEAKEISDPVWKRVFAVGDCADAFGAIKAGHTGWNQAEVAAKNVLRLIKWEEAGGKVDKVDIAETLAEGEEQEGKLLRYEHRAPMMKLTLGLVRSALSSFHGRGTDKNGRAAPSPNSSPWTTPIRSRSRTTAPMPRRRNAPTTGSTSGVRWAIPGKNATDGIEARKQSRRICRRANLFASRKKCTPGTIPRLGEIASFR